MKLHKWNIDDTFYFVCLGVTSLGATAALSFVFALACGWLEYITPLKYAMMIGPIITMIAWIVIGLKTGAMSTSDESGSMGMTLGWIVGMLLGTSSVATILFWITS